MTIDGSTPEAILGFCGPLAAAKYCGEAHSLRGSDREKIRVYVALDRPILIEYTHGQADDEYAGLEGSVTVSKATRGGFRTWLLSASRDILNTAEVWQAVRALARALLEREELNGKEAIEVIEQHIVRKCHTE